MEEGSDLYLWYGRVKNGQIVDKTLNAEGENSEPLSFDIKSFALHQKIFQDEREYYSTLRELIINSEEMKLTHALKEEDKYIIALIKTLDEIIRDINLLNEKYRELKDLGYEDEENLILREIKTRINGLEELREIIEEEIRDKMEAIAPNLTSVAGGIVGARLIERAGGLDKLARMPGSKIQVIGAERALFMALRKKKKGKPPKHGVIYQHPYIRTLRKAVRGKMARYLSSKIAIAARIDCFGKTKYNEIAEQVKQRYENLNRGSE
jgi:nucleolar protein 56